MRIALFTQGSKDNGSAYFRALQFVPLLASRGLDVAPSPASVAVRRFDGSAGAAVLLAEHGLSYALRAGELHRLVRQSDTVFIQRGAYPIGPATLLSSLRGFDGRVIYDLDDAIFLPTPTLAHRSRLARWMYEDRQSLFLLERADAVIVSTAELDEALPGRRADVVLPTIPDVSAYPTAVQEDAGPLRLGWIGSSGNLAYLEPLREVLGRLSHDGVAQLQVISAAPWSGPASFRQWSRESEANAVAGFEVGIMPLPDSPYTRAKAGFKLLQYMAAGCAVIASPVGINAELVERSGAGLLASSPEEWETAIRSLAADVARRRSFGAAGRLYVQSFADREHHADVISAVLHGDAHPEVPALASASRAR
jgi:hypothetical protein